MELHKVHVTILDTLRRQATARYSVLRSHTDLESDSFKFYLRKLVSRGYVEKLESGEYGLTRDGKEFANSLDTAQQAALKQPKLSLLMVAARSDDSGSLRYLVQQRARSPFRGYWGFLSGPMQWGEAPEDTAAREFLKQTGLTAKFRVKAFYRQQDIKTEDGTLVRDRLFVVLEAYRLKGELSNEWGGGENHWLTRTELRGKEKYFTSCKDVISLLISGNAYKTGVAEVSNDEY
ncbi:NUDIX domain-containing protein [Candidatus Saccharibacteria bacterium]|nr:NUDIX domain-containing protein [Candidatus Saccharibacteria bacterium]